MKQVGEPEIHSSSIERHSLSAWPGLSRSQIGGWALTFGGGHTKRANSACLTLGDAGAPLDWIPAIVDAYHAEGAPAIFRITPPAVAAGVDRHFDIHGFPAFDETRVQTLDLAADTAMAPHSDVELVRSADARWRRDLAAAQGFVGRAAALQSAIFDRIEPACLFATARASASGDSEGWGMGVLSDGLLGLFNIIVQPASRGRGVGGRLVGALLDAGRAMGATQAYLQVGAANEPALALYARIGFRDSYRYHYRNAG